MEQISKIEKIEQNVSVKTGNYVNVNQKVIEKTRQMLVDLAKMNLSVSKDTTRKDSMGIFVYANLTYKNTGKIATSLNYSQRTFVEYLGFVYENGHWTLSINRFNGESF